MDHLDAQLRLIFILEAEHQMEAVEVASGWLTAGLEAADIEQIWAAVDLTLIGLTRLSRIFWPIPPAKGQPRDRVARGEAMRELVDAPDHPPTALLSVRHAVEHFDERIDSWFATSERRGFVDRNVGSADMVAGMSAGDFGRHLDPATGTISVFGVSVDLPLAIEGARVLVDALPQR